jgi:flagellar biosynthesis anti-sigma factor FlgM
MDLSKVGTDRVGQTQVSEQSATQKSQAAKDAQKNSKAHGAQLTKQQTPVKWSADSQLIADGVQMAKSANAEAGRTEKVAAIKAAIQNGTYKTDAKKIAEKMIQSSLEDDLATKNG